MDITKSAAALIADHVRRRDNGQGGFRIRRGEHSDHGSGLLVGYVDEPMPDDAVVKAGRARVFVAEDARESVDPYTLDVRKEGSEFHLFLRA